MSIDYHIILDVIKSTLTITYLVMMMMIFIEFINVNSSGKLLTSLQNRPFRKLFLLFIRTNTGCIARFYYRFLIHHRLLSFGALVAG